MLVDTHAHLHFDDYAERVDEVLANAKAAGVDKILTVGIDETDSAQAIEFAKQHEGVFPTVGLHPHEAARGQAALDRIAALANNEAVVAIGECGLDFFKEYSPRDQQRTAFKFQIELALELDKPLIFHVRDAFDEFFETVDQYQNVRGVVHCFTSDRSNMEKAIECGLYVAFNGIMTFTKDLDQLEAAKHCLLDQMLLETDCPFLTPAPFRGRQNQPANLKLTAEFLANLRGESFDQLATQTSQNASRLFKL